MRRVSLIPMLCVACTASLPLHGEEPAVSIGKRLAADLGVRWDVREVKHPLLGPIKFAVQRNDVATTVGNEKILSLTYVSCQKNSGKVAIELTNAPASAPAEGLGPVDLPRLVCSSPSPQGAVLVKSDLAASWEIGVLGDTLARGLSPAGIRRCVSIDVLQHLALPPGWPRESQRVALQITPYGRELDAVFAECGEATAFAHEDSRRVAAPAMRLDSAPGSERKSQREDLPWRAARTIAKGRTNVRAAASLDSPVVIRLDPGARILVQPTSAQWWRVKPRSGAGFGGYVRQDRLKLERPRG